MRPHHIIILQLRNFCLPQSYKAQRFNLTLSIQFWTHVEHKATVVLQTDIL